MLKKLLKYEFKATARTYGGMYLALLAASVLFGGSLWRWNSTNSDAYSTLVGLLSLVYTGVIIGTVVVTIMTIVQRFYRNLLGREGYLMHTLPVTETQLVTSKLISSTVWSLCSILAACLSFGILAVLMMADMDLLEQLPLMWSGIREAFARCNMEFWEALAFSGVVSFVRMVSAIACIYAACMVGHQFKNHPALAGILSFFVMQYLQGWLEKLLQIGTGVYETAIYSIVGDVGSIETAVSALGYMGSAMVTLGIAAAFILTAKKERRKRTAAAILPLAVTASLASITEPVDFLFCFVSPVLWVLHAALAGGFMVLLNALQVRAFTSNLLGSLVFNLSAAPQQTHRVPLLYLLGVLEILTYAVVFSAIIRVFDLPTPGRAPERETAARQIDPEGIRRLLAALGGPGNICTVDNCFTRLRITVKDPDRLDTAALLAMPHKGLVQDGPYLQLVCGLQAAQVRRAVDRELEQCAVV